MTSLDTLTHVIQLALPPPALLLRANVIVAAISFATGVVLARGLEPHARGELANLILWPTMISHVALAGIHLHLSRRGAISPASIHRNYKHGLFAVALTSTVGILFYTTLASASFIPTTHSGALLNTWLASLIIPLSAWNTFQIQCELTRRNLRLYNWAKISFALTYLCGVAVLANAYSDDITHYLAAFLGAAAIAAASTGYCIHLGAQSDATALRNTIREALAVICRSWRFGLSVCVATLSAAADRLLVSLFFDAQTMGYYTIAVAAAAPQALVTESIAPLFFARLARQPTIASVDSEWVGMRLRQAIFINALIFLPTILTVPVLLPLVYGQKYSTAAPLLLFLLPGFSIRSAMRPFEEILKGGNRPLTQTVAVVLMGAVVILGGLLGAAVNSVEGVAIGLFGSSLVGLGIVANAVAVATNNSLANVLVPGPNDIRRLRAELKTLTHI